MELDQRTIWSDCLIISLVSVTVLDCFISYAKEKELSKTKKRIKRGVGVN